MFFNAQSTSKVITRTTKWLRRRTREERYKKKWDTTDSHEIPHRVVEARLCSQKWFFCFQVHAKSCLLISDIMTKKKKEKSLNYSIFTTGCHGNNPKWPQNTNNDKRFVPNLSNNHLFLLLKLIDKHITFILSKGIWVILVLNICLFDNICVNSGIIFIYIIINQRKIVLW